MAFNNWILNEVPDNAASMYYFKEMLVSAGWTVLESGTGTSGSYNSSGDSIIITTMNTSRAWFRISNGTSELCIQRGTSGTQYYWIKYSPSAGFTSGSPDEDDMPTASDEVDVYSSNNSGTQLFGTDGTYVLQGGAGDAASGYSFWLVGYSFNSGTPRTAFVMEALSSTDSLDTDPGKQNLFYANYSGFGSVLQANQISYSASAPLSFIGASFVRIPGNYLVFSPVGFENYGAAPTANNSYSGEDYRIPILYARRTALGGATGYKGIGTNMMFEFTPRSNASTKGGKTRIAFDAVSFPWDGTTNPLV